VKKMKIEFEVQGHSVKITLDGKGGAIETDLRDGRESADSERYDAAIDGIESLILAQACAGFDVKDPKYIEAVETALDAVAFYLT